MQRHDVAEKRQAEVEFYRELLAGGGTQTEAQRLFVLLMESLDSAIFWKDRDSRYLGCNRAFAECAGLPISEIIGKRDADLIWATGFEDTLEGIADVDRGVIDTGTRLTGIRQHVPFADGELHWVVINKVPFTSLSGETIGVLGTLVDITAQTIVETQLKDTLTDLDDRVRSKTEELVRANESMRREVEDRVRLQAQEHQLREYAEAMRDTLSEMTEARGIDNVLDSVMAGVMRLLPADLVAIALSQPDGTLVLARQHVASGYEIHAGPPSPQRIAAVVDSALSDPGSHSLERTLGPAASLVVAPMRVGGADIGYLMMESRIRSLYSNAHRERLHAIAASAAATVANHQLAEKASLLGANQERDRLARSLHESLSQTIWSLSVTAESAMAATGGEDPPQVLRTIHALTQEAKVAMRALLSNEEFALVTGGDLVDAVSKLVETSFTSTGPEVITSLESLELTTEEATGLFRIAQEALNNIGRHAMASIVTVTITGTPTPMMRISDDGQGFDSDERLSGHMGLEIIRRRATEIGAVLELQTTVGEGTSIAVFLDRV